MLRIIAGYRFPKLLQGIYDFGEVNTFTYPEFKKLFIEALRCAVKADSGCKDNMIAWNMLGVLKRNAEWLKDRIPAEYYADIFNTIRDMTRKDNPELWHTLDEWPNGF